MWWDWEGTLLDPSVGGGSALSSKILDFEKTCNAWWLWRWTCDNKKQTIHWQWMIWARGVAATPRGCWNLPELGGSFKWAGVVQPPTPLTIRVLNQPVIHQSSKTTKTSYEGQLFCLCIKVNQLFFRCIRLNPFRQGDTKCVYIFVLTV